MQKNGLPYHLLQRIENGEEKTRQQWAEEFHVPIRRIDNALGHLRKRYHYSVHPIGTQAFEEAGGGVLKIVTETQRNYKETRDRLKRNYVTPSLRDIFLLLENYFLEDPQHLAEVELQATQLLSALMDAKQMLLEEKVRQQEKVKLLKEKEKITA